jgi:hypothetical protein
MSGFLVAHSSLSAAMVEQLAQTQEAAGFERILDRFFGQWRLIQFAPLSSNRPVALIDGGAEGCIGVHGHFSYKGMAEHAGLSAAHRDISANCFSLTDAVGPFVLATGDKDGVRLKRDPLSPYRLYVNRDRTLISTLFMSLVEACSSLTIEPQGFYEYVWLESFYGTLTPFAEIEVLPPGDDVVLGDSGCQLSAAPYDLHRPSWNAGNFDDNLEHYAQTLIGMHKPHLQGFGKRVRTALSGGFDSRLCVAAQRAVGSQISLQVHGGPENPDRQIAETISKALDLPLRIIDPTKPQIGVPLGDFRAHNDRYIVQADGPANYGSISPGSGIDQRLSRLENVDLFVNGGGGEIFRNFFYLRDQRWTVNDVVGSFYSRYQPSANTAQFDRVAFSENLAGSICSAIGAPDARTKLPRNIIERTYPLVRLRYWTALDLMINTRVGGAFYPFLCHQIISGTENIPVKWKTHGRFEARLINRLDSQISSFKSDYGFSFDGEPSLAYRMKMIASYWRPIWLRRQSYKLQARGKPKRDSHLSEAHQKELYDPRMPGVARWVKPDAIISADAFARAATIEFILSWRERADRAGGGANLIYGSSR